MFMIDQAKAQGIERESLSGESIAAQLRQSSVSPNYNLKIGPVGIRLDASLTTSYSDNINLSKAERIGDFTTTPSVGLNAHWAVSDLNTLDFHMGIGYQTYLSHSQYNSILLSPDSEANFNFFVAEVAINVHDSFSYQQDPTQIGQLSNTVRLSRFQNDAGVSATWDAGSFVLTLGYDHTNFWVTDSTYDYLTNQSDSISPRVSYKINESIQTGLEGGFSDVRYEQSFQNDYKTLTVGPFVTAEVSKNLSINARGGGYFSDYANGGGNGDSENVSSFYASAGLTHRINDALTESVTAGREYIPGLTSNFTERIYTNYTLTWQATNYLNLGGNFLWENLTDSAATVSEKSNRYGFGLNLTDNLTEHATLDLNYQYLLKDADPSFLGYEQNQGTVGINYHF